MNFRLLFALIPLLFVGAPGYAQSHCSDCLKAAEEVLKHCLDNAISADDKMSCHEKRQAGMKACVNDECRVERDQLEKRDTGNEQQTPNRPGLTPYTPMRIEWLALLTRASLRQAASTDSPYSLDIIPVDHETLLIVVRYLPTANREIVNRAITTAQNVIRSTAASYGWDTWVKIQERVEMVPPQK
jgi:hypothetical protein